MGEKEREYEDSNMTCKKAWRTAYYYTREIRRIIRLFLRGGGLTGKITEYDASHELKSITFYGKI